MSRIYDALKKLEAERSGRTAGNGGGRNGGNGHGGNGKNGGNGKKRRWSWLFGNGGQHRGVEPRVVMSMQLGPEAEDAYQRLGTNLLVSPMQGTEVPRLIGVTASRHGEGTTTTAAVFASILVRRRGGRVVVVEANFRTPSFDSVFGIRRDGGFAEIIRGEKPLAEVAVASEIPNLYVIGCGNSPLGAPALFDSPNVAPALDQLRAHFDFAIFDLPPAGVYGDASILAPRLDAALMVIEADRTRIPEVERARRSLERVGVRLVGSVLNRRRSYIPAFLEEIL